LKMLFHNTFKMNDLRRVGKKPVKNDTKWIDRSRGAGLVSARRHDGGRPRDRMSIAVLTKVNPPDRLFSPLETSSLTGWLSANRAKYRL